MRKKRLTIWLALFLSYLFALYCGEPTSSNCRKDSDCPENHVCSEGTCSKVAPKEKVPKDKYEKIQAEKRPTSETLREPDAPTSPDEQSTTDEAKPSESTEPTDELGPPDGPSYSDEFNTAEEGSGEGERDTFESETPLETVSGEGSGKCGGGMIYWRGRCVTAEKFCTTKFSQAELVHMKKPYSVVFDKSGTPFFCETKDGSYYLPGQGYRFCDRDGDGWLNIEAYRAITSAEKAIRINARCKLRKIDAIVYHSDLPNAKPQIQFLLTSVPLIETSRNDGAEKLIDLPVYSDGSAPLPKGQSSACQADSHCNTSSGELCYRGYCVKGRRFKPSEINTFTKACIKNIDLNHNLLDDPSETPKDSPQPPEFAPLLKYSYFVELNYGYYEKSYNIGGKKIPVYHIFERSRRAPPAKRGLALLCGEKATAAKPNYWRYCYLKDDQQCKTSSGSLKKGLSPCWMENVKHGTRSLFKCAVFDGQKDPDKYFFHPSNFGLDKKYTRTVCRLKGDIPGQTKDRDDVEFECTLKNTPPNLSQKEVGWACINFFGHYSSPQEYLAGCIDECVESKHLPGAAKPCGTNNSCSVEKDSYGRGRFTCTIPNSQGGCKENFNYCQWGKWTVCPKRTPSVEVCDGLDNDCDGKIDESPTDPNKVMRRACYTGKSGCTKKSDGTYTCTSPCKTGVQICFNKDWSQCYGEVHPQPEKCDGVDNDCDGAVDEDWNINARCYDQGPYCIGKLKCKGDQSGTYCATPKTVRDPEKCNGLDDDCDGAVDEVCPAVVLYSPVKFTGITSSTIDIGGIANGNSPVTTCAYTSCPDGSAVIGIYTASKGVNWIQTIKYICSELLFTPIQGQNGAIEYKVKFGRKISYDCASNTYKWIPPRSYQKALCPEGSVLVGFSGSTSSYIDQLTIWCSEVVVSGNQLSLKTARRYGQVGGPKAGKNTFGKKLCIDGVVTGLKVIYSNKKHSEIVGIQAQCQKMEVLSYKKFGNPINKYSNLCKKNTRCPPGKVAIGIRAARGKKYSRLYKIGVICGIVRIKENKITPNNFSYQVEIVESSETDTCSFTTNTSYRYKCPKGYVLIGFSGRKGKSYLYQLTLYCSKVKLNEINGVYKVALTTEKKGPTFNSKTTLGYSFSKILCPTDSALTGLDVSLEFPPGKSYNRIVGFSAFCHRLNLGYKK